MKATIITAAAMMVFSLVFAATALAQNGSPSPTASPSPSPTASPQMPDGAPSTGLGGMHK